MQKHYSLICTTLLVVALLLCGALYCRAYNFKSTSTYHISPASNNLRGQRIPTKGTPNATFYGGTVLNHTTTKTDVIFTPFSNETPSDNNNPANNGGTSNNDDDEEVIPGTPSDPIPPTEYPIGEPWIMLLFAAAATAVVYAKKQNINSQKTLRL